MDRHSAEKALLGHTSSLPSSRPHPGWLDTVSVPPATVTLGHPWQHLAAWDLGPLPPSLSSSKGW